MASNMYPDKLWLETPLIRSIHISSLLGCNAYLKLETFQPPQSFKARGISHFAQNAVRTRGPGVRLVIASSGNAGIAAAWAAKALGVRCTVYLPHGVSQSTIDFMRKDGAEVVVEGSYYHEALQAAHKAVAADPNSVMVPSYNDPLLWEGHASLIHEIKRQLPEGTVPDAIFCSVGGGGLAGGIMTGCKAVGWDHVPLVGVETHGSNCFYQSLSLNDGPFVGKVESRKVPDGTTAKYDETNNVTVTHIAKLTSRISSLGATSPSPAVVKMALQRPGGIKSVCVSDEHTMQACLSFADDHKLLVELACSATLTPAYNRSLFRALVPPSEKQATVVFVLCGGFKVSLQDLKEYENIVDDELRVGGNWVVALNGESLRVPKV
ncbi:tryptophan synthase beta subunit-like PLP-dependent enzyme [Lentinus tigrinus ALCF2SS1-7]|uniref:L-serine ammonia-lyase n=1 Tax=Lentinus tigrinus ALCF2SS1-6 TaxID=1328759 RepID=A0A5C2RND8_9APHY|nr:tryptophan synthase beta subunit-like PLP-dependent enzyme [Lentinus tigrinus ALCF2SS1-6]RPD75365.1 tryptophan synthase beta subunit-like PLP-dependent enzyme [Lentinus tigrinus ALCF2SS1-7]